MSVYLRDGKAYYFDFRFRGTRYRGSLGPVSREDAVQAEAVMRQQVATAHLPGRQHVATASLQGRQRQPRYRWQQMVDEFAVYNRNNCRAATIRQRRVSCESLEPFFGHIDPQDLRPEHIEVYKQAMLSRGLSKTTINKYLESLQQMINRAWEAKHLKELPIRRFPMIPKADQPRTRVFTHEEEARLLLACPPEARTKIILAFNTGLRKTEVNTLTWECVDVERRLITILAQYSKTGKQGIVPMNAVVWDMLLALKPTPAKGPVFRHKTCSSAFLRARIKAGLDPELKFHSCRHSFASRLIEKGVEITTVQLLLRHADIAQTVRYVHHGLDRLFSAVDALGSGPKPTGMSLTG